MFTPPEADHTVSGLVFSPFLRNHNFLTAVCELKYLGNYSHSSWLNKLFALRETLLCGLKYNKPETATKQVL